MCNNFKTAPQDPEKTDIAPFFSPEAALPLVSIKNRDLWPSPTPEVRDSRDFPSFCTCSKSNRIGSGLNLLCLQSHSKPEMSLDLARGPQRSNECACLSRARARVGVDCIISIETSKRQNGGRFKFRGMCFISQG